MKYVLILTIALLANSAFALNPLTLNCSSGHEPSQSDFLITSSRAEADGTTTVFFSRRLGGSMVERQISPATVSEGRKYFLLSGRTENQDYVYVLIWKPLASAIPQESSAHKGTYVISLASGDIVMTENIFCRD